MKMVIELSDDEIEKLESMFCCHIEDDDGGEYYIHELIKEAM